MSVDLIRQRGRRELQSLRVAFPSYVDFYVSSAMDRHQRRGSYAVSDAVLSSSALAAVNEFSVGLPLPLRNRWREIANLLVAQDLLAGGDGAAAVATLSGMMPRAGTLAASLLDRSMSDQQAFADTWWRDAYGAVRIDGLPPGWGLAPGDVGGFDSAVAAQWVQTAAAPVPVAVVGPGPPIGTPGRPGIDIPFVGEMNGAVAAPVVPLPSPVVQPIVEEVTEMIQYPAPPMLGRPISGTPTGGVSLDTNQRFLGGLGDIIKENLGLIGGAVGTVIGGPAGGAIGAGLGNALGGGRRNDAPDLPAGFPTPGGVPTITPQPQPQPQPQQGPDQLTLRKFASYLSGLGEAYSVFMSPMWQWPAGIKAIYDRWVSGDLSDMNSRRQQIGPPMGTEPVGQGGQPYPVHLGGPGSGMLPQVYDGMQYDPLFLPVVMEQCIKRAPKGYVTVTDKITGQTVYAKKSVARRKRFGWKPPKKPLVTASQVNAMDKALEAVEALDGFNKKAKMVSRGLARHNHEKVVDKDAKLYKKPTRRK